MLELIPDLPHPVVGVAASGQVTAHDYETVFMPAIASRVAAHEKVRILYQLGPSFTGFTAGAAPHSAQIQRFASANSLFG